MLQSSSEWRFHKVGDRDRVMVAMDNEKVVGYIIYRVDHHDGVFVMRILDLVARDEKARLTLLDYVKKYGDQAQRFTWHPNGDEPLTEYFTEPGENQVKVQTSGSVMFRVVDVQKAIEELSYPDGGAVFTLRVIDEHAPWNQTPIRVTIHDGEAEVEEIGEAEVDVVMDIRAFSQLYVGYRSLEQLTGLGKAVVDGEKASTISSMFPVMKTRVILDF